MMIRRIQTTNTLSLSNSIIYSAFGILMLQTPAGIWGGGGSMPKAKTTNHVSSFSTPPIFNPFFAGGVDGEWGSAILTIDGSNG